MYEEQSQKHEMVLRSTDESGSEEWYCPICGRRFKMQWPPKYEKIILDPGDEYAIHSGGKSGAVQVDAEQSLSTSEAAIPSANLPLTPEDDQNLTPFLDWMDKTKFNDLWTKEN